MSALAPVRIASMLALAGAAMLALPCGGIEAPADIRPPPRLAHPPGEPVRDHEPKQRKPRPPIARTREEARRVRQMARRRVS